MIITLIITRVGFVLPSSLAADSMPDIPGSPSIPGIPGTNPNDRPGVPPPPATAGSSIPEVPSIPSQNQITQSVSAPSLNVPLPTAEEMQSALSPLPTSQSEGDLSENDSMGQSNNAEGANTNSSNSGEVDNLTLPSGENSQSASVNDPLNSQTGANSQNAAYESLNKKLEVMNQNLAQMQNKIDNLSVSGFNYADLNTLDGQVFTGDALSSLSLLNKLNSSLSGLGTFSVYNVYGNFYNDLLLQLADNVVVDSSDGTLPTISKNIDTGFNSSNQAIADNTLQVNEQNGNDASLTNEINLQAVSGSNSASFNTGNGIIQTGNATAIGNIINMTNTNINVSKWLIGVVNIFGKMAGDILLPADTTDSQAAPSQPAFEVANSATGAFSDNQAILNDSKTANYENNNTAVIQSTLNTTANSGNNDAGINTGGGIVLTGASDVSVLNTTIANTNTVQEDDTVWMVIVNQAGHWIGQILGSPWGSNYASNLPAGSVTSKNENTGMSSDNIASYSQNETTDITNINDANISNNITANADSGSNTAIYNTGAGVIETGDAKVALNLVNMANNNITAKKFYAVFVNVLGEFLGNIVPPSQHPVETNSNANNSPSDENSLSNNIGGTDEVLSAPSPTPTIVISTAGSITNNESNQNFTQDSYTYYYTDYYYQQALNQYQKQVNSVKQKKAVIGAASKSSPSIKEVKVVRGLFLSPAFARATETTLAGMLLGGARFQVTSSWLTILPLGVIIFFLRRKRREDLYKLLNNILEVIL